MAEIDPIDAALLNAAQTAFPLNEDPWASLGAPLGLDGAAVLKRLERLRQERVLRQIGAIFDSRALGYHSALVAARVSPARLEQAAAVVSSQPGVSHNYQREHAFNLWFTLATPPEQPLEAAAAKLAKEAGLDAHHVLPSLRTFRIGVSFDLAAKGARNLGGDAAPKRHPGPVALSHLDRAAVRQLQEPLALEPRPFRRMARALGLDEMGLFAWLKGAQERGFLRRYAAVLRHREAGFGEGGMGVWEVPEPQVEALGQAMARHSAVTHCYQRPRFEDWPFNLFTMVHGQDREACQAVLQQLADSVPGWVSRAVLFSVREFKKERVRYFVEAPSHA